MFVFHSFTVFVYVGGTRPLMALLSPVADFIQANSSKLRFYYGTTDAWVPISYYREMKELFPDGDIRLCEEGYEHAFVIRSSEEMALVVWGWVLELFEQ